MDFSKAAPCQRFSASYSNYAANVNGVLWGGGHGRNMMDQGFPVNPFAPSKVAMSFTG